MTPKKYITRAYTAEATTAYDALDEKHVLRIEYRVHAMNQIFTVSLSQGNGDAESAQRFWDNQTAETIEAIFKGEVFPYVAAASKIFPAP